ncbi:MAG: radical SAM protein [Fibrobacteria bacterium]|nr:radical SAM protein [Fibrobacteria bacterium]
MKQIVLIQPWIEDFYTTSCRIQPIGLAYLASSITQQFPNLEVIVIDCLAGGRKRSIPWPKEFSYLKAYYGYPDNGPFSLFYQYYRFGQSEKEIRNTLRKHSPDLIGISSLFSPYYRQSLAMAEICKELFPMVPVVMGGNHASMHPHTLLFAQASGSKIPGKMRPYLCDFVLRGEAEESFCGLIKCLMEKKSLSEESNLVNRDFYKSQDEKGRNEENEKLPALVSPSRNDIPIPDFSGLMLHDYEYDNRPMSFLITTRSCRFRCSFCSVHAVFGKQFWARPVKHILEEIKGRFEEGVRHFDIEDDDFAGDKEFCSRLLEEIYALKLPITFSAMNGLNYRSLDEELLRLLKRAGFEMLNLSLVSVKKEIRQMTGRPGASDDDFFNVVQLATGMGFRVIAYTILGMPGQTIKDMWDSLRCLASASCLIGASPFYFTPGSPIHCRLKNDENIKLASLGKDVFFSARLTTMDVETDAFSREDIYTLFRLSRLLNYLKEGVDKGLQTDDVYFRPAIEALHKGEWFAESSGGKNALPFSNKVHEATGRRPLEVSGYRTQQKQIFY